MWGYCNSWGILFPPLEKKVGAHICACPCANCGLCLDSPCPSRGRPCPIHHPAVVGRRVGVAAGEGVPPVQADQEELPGDLGAEDGPDVHVVRQVALFARHGFPVHGLVAAPGLRKICKKRRRRRRSATTNTFI